MGHELVGVIEEVSADVKKSRPAISLSRRS